MPVVNRELGYRSGDGGAMSPDKPVSDLASSEGSYSAAFDHVAVFRSLDREDVSALVRSCRCRTYARTELICCPDDVPSSLFVIATGSARAYRLSSKGQDVTMDTFGPGSVFGLVFFDSSAISKNFLEATSDETQVYQIPSARLRQVIAAYPGVALSLLELAGRRLEDARDRIADLALYNVKTRLARTLARLAAQGGDDNVHATHRELASLVGTRTEEVTKALRELRANGLITYAGHSGIVVVDPRLISYGDTP